MSTTAEFPTEAATDELPSSWAWVRVESLAADRVGALTDGPFGSNLKTSHYTENGPRVIRLQNIGDGVFHDEKAHIPREHFERLRKHEAMAQDIVVAMLGAKLPRACLVPDYVGPAIVKADCARLRVDPRLALPGLVAAGLNSQSLRRQADELIHGVGRPRLGLRWLKTLQFPLAPLPEQHRIVEAIESYFTRIDDAVATLERVQRNLKRFRASVLKAAVEGLLVPTEAELARAEGRDYEPAPVLLERILAERRRRWQEASGLSKYQEPDAPDTNKLPKLPEGWCWATGDQVSERITKGSSPRWQGFDYCDDGIPFVRSQNVRWGSLDLADLVCLPEAFNQKERRSVLCADDVLLNIVGASIGRAAVADARVAGGNTNQAVAIIRLVRPGLLSRFACLYLISPDTQRSIHHAKVDVARANLSLADIANLPFPLAPAAEQARIVSDFERLISLANVADETIVMNQARAARLRQVILKWAFEGKLADQDSSDEPVTALLERIRSQTLASRLSVGDTEDRRFRRGGTRRFVRAENKP